MNLLNEEYVPEYVPYSEAWEKEIMKLPKQQIVRLFKEVGEERGQLRELVGDLRLQLRLSKLQLAKQVPPEPC